MEHDFCEINAFKCLADKCGLSEKTLRTAFSKKPITWRTACKIARTLGIEVASFRIKDDARGRNKGRK